MIFGILSKIKNKPREFKFRPTSYDPDLKEFRDKVKERKSDNEAKRFDFRKNQQLKIRRELQNQIVRFAIIMCILLIIAYYIFTSQTLDNIAHWLTNGR